MPFEIWNGFIFVNLDHGGPKETLRQYLGEHLWNGFDGYPFEKMTERYSMVAHAKANWKGMIDGFSEIYHAGTTHAEPFKGSPMDDSSSFPVDYFGLLGRHYQYVTRRYPPTHTNFEYERVTQGFGTGPRYPFGVEIDLLPKGADPLQFPDWGTSSNTIFPNMFLQIYHPGYLVTYGMWPLAYDQMRFEMSIYMTASRNFSELLSHKASVSMFSTPRCRISACSRRSRPGSRRVLSRRSVDRRGGLRPALSPADPARGRGVPGGPQRCALND